MYRPQFFKENYPMVKLVTTHLEESSIEQYRKEERSQMAKRLITSQKRFKLLIACMTADHISTKENLKQLKFDLVEYSKDIKFKRARSMGGILKTALEFVKRNYVDTNSKEIMEF